MPDFENKSPYRCAVQRDYMGMGVSITFGLVYGGTEIRVMQYGTQEWHSQDRMMVVEKPTMRLEEEFARALYEELARYFGYEDADTRSLRKDYEHTRNQLVIAETRYHELAMRSISALEAFSDE